MYEANPIIILQLLTQLFASVYIFIYYIVVVAFITAEFEAYIVLWPYQHVRMLARIVRIGNAQTAA